MRIRTRLAAAIGTGVVATVLIASPSLAAPGPGTDGPAARGDGPGQQRSQQRGDCDPAAARQATPQGQHGPGARGRGAGTGSVPGAYLSDVAGGTLTTAQKTTLAAMAEEEKLAHDLYVGLAEQHGTRVFSRIADAETRHLTEVRIVLDRYAVADPTAGQAVGTFATERTQKLYDELLAQGATSLDDAYAAARSVESTDIADLTTATTGVTAPDVLAVYAHLSAGSGRHLVAFGG